MNSHPPDSRIVDLSAGLLGPDETRQLVEHIRGCPECEARLRSVVADHEALRAGPSPVMRDGRIERGAPPRRSRVLVRAGLVAAVLVVVAVAVFRLIGREEAEAYWIPVTSEATVLRAPVDSHNTVAHVLRAYQAHDANAAVRELEALNPPPDDFTATTLRDLYLASALVNADRPEEALAVLSRHYVDVLPTQWRFHAQWVQYLALERAGKDDEAKAWLEKLATEPGEMGEKARKEIQQRR